MRYPDFLKKNGKIGFVAPSFGCVDEPYFSAFVAALGKFSKRGYRTEAGPNCLKNDGVGISSTPKNCASEFMDFYLSPDMDVLISCGGGELMCEILDYIDFEALWNARPKWFMGYSDNTNLVYLSATLMDTAAIYGPCAGAFGMKKWHRSLEDALGVLTGEKTVVTNYDKWESESLKTPENPLAEYNLTNDFMMVKNVEPNLSFEGRLLGGCIDCLNILAGSSFDHTCEFIAQYRYDGVIWVFEACDLNVFDMRRVLFKLKHCGWFRYANGFLIGRPRNYSQTMMGMDWHEAVMSILGPLNVPILMDLDIGHLPPMMPLVMGAYAKIQTKGNSVEIKYEWK